MPRTLLPAGAEEERNSLVETADMVNTTNDIEDAQSSSPRRSASKQNFSSRHLIEVDSKVTQSISDFVSSDDNNDKTWSRLFVEKVLMQKSWYYTRGDKTFDLKDGWAFYEHMTLARHLAKNGKSDPIFRAEPGEKKPTELYSFFETSGEALNDWGIGIALYFNTITVMAVGLLLAYLLSLPSVIYYSSDEYGAKQSSLDVSVLLRGSAVCNETEWAPCEDNYCDEYQLKNLPIMTYVDENTGTTFVQRNACEGPKFIPAMFNYGAIMLLLVITFLFNWYQTKKSVVYDEDRLTATDYSIRVKNPPKDAYDPDEWEQFFCKYDDKGVAVVTILLNNQPLLRLLDQRRVLRKEMKRWFPELDIDNEDNVKNRTKKFEEEKEYNPNCFKKLIVSVSRPFVKCLNMLMLPGEISNKLEDINSKVDDLQKNGEYDVTDVFVTFETEAGQRLALTEMNTGRIDIARQNTSNRISNNLFRGEHVLDAVEPPEPSAVRWLDLGTSPTVCVIRQVITFVVTFGLVVLGGLMVHQLRRTSGAFSAGILTTVLNTLIPHVVKLLMLLEKHASEDDRQQSMYIKITMFRWVNTAITVKFAAAFTKTLKINGEDLLPAISGIFVSEIFLVPALSLLDIMGNLSKHFFAPRAETIEQLFLCFRGTPYNLAEKYTDLSKILFLSYYYCALHPNVLLMGFVALFARYYADKYCLMRIWSPAPYIGTNLAAFSRKYFFSFAIVAGAVVSSYDWALFKFDRICKGEGDTVRVCTADRCCQEVRTRFPPVPNRFQNDDFKWMDEEQEQISMIYGWTSFALVIGFLVITFGESMVNLFISMFKGVYKEVGQDQQIDFSSVQDIGGYIPQIPNRSGPHFLLTCDIDDVDQSLIGWNEPDKSYDEYNLIFDKPYNLKRAKMIEKNTRSTMKVRDHPLFRASSTANNTAKPIYSIVKSWSMSDRNVRRDSLN